ncbi:MAG: sulfite oxidase [Gemmatimonadota bacterium]|uniref:sulfite oxidase n=1 Tax=Candidatus Palauibacter scopulicola TaxID=3056741 RepID=UPI0023887FC3|nr:sulfite oxidase [Candidatus Palauibacter scopulicola]MDE2662351.1 sulfite oxidase [Candidatus Palauibacter scopulicola]
MSERNVIPRRQVLIRGGAAAAGLAVLPADIFRGWLAGFDQEAVIPWVQRPHEGMRERVNVLNWEEVDSWITPTDQMFRVGHYGSPVIAESDWSLEIGGLVDRPRTFSLAELRARPRQEVVFTLECSGNRGRPSFMGAVHNARWAGARLADVLAEAGVQEAGIEVVFFGADEGEEEIRGNTVTQNFARSMSLEDAMDPGVILAWEMNGEPLPNEYGFPLRVIAPGWYGIANVKWLTRIELRDRRFMGKFMARDYVTLRAEERDGATVWTETSVGRVNINSVPAKVTRDGGAYAIHGAAWGADIAAVEVRVDEGPWEPATLGEGQGDPHTWTFWRKDWDATPGRHAIVSRAIDADGNVQPAADDPMLVNKRTYWESNGQLTRDIVID